jgi:signal peptidase I
MRLVMAERKINPSIVEKVKIEKSEAIGNKAYPIIRYLIFLIGLYMLFTFGIGIIQVSGNSMSPSLKDGSFLLNNKFVATYKHASFGDVVVIKEEHQQFNIVKRVIGVPGDTVAIYQGKVYVNDVAIPEVYSLGIPTDMEPVIVPKDHIFVMGDNRTPGESLDSRDPIMGPVPNSSVKGYPIISIFPFYKIAGPLEF